MERRKRATKRQAESVLRAVKKRFKAWLDDDGKGPELVMDFDWSGYGGSPAIVWEGGPYEWAIYDPHGDIEEEFGIRFGPMRIPKGVYTEPITGWALGIYPTDW